MKKTKLPYSPTKTDLVLLIVALFTGCILTGVVFPMLISTDSMPLSLIMLLLMVMLLCMIIGIQGLMNYFYCRVIDTRKKNDKRKAQ